MASFFFSAAKERASAKVARASAVSASIGAELCFWVSGCGAAGLGFGERLAIERERIVQVAFGFFGVDALLEQIGGGAEHLAGRDGG
jgi:hypothetical protein